MSKDQAWTVLTAAIKEADKHGISGLKVAKYALTQHKEVTGEDVAVRLNPYWSRIQKQLKGTDMATTGLRIFTAYQDKGGKWRWRCQAKNGRIVSASGESFHDRYNAIRAATKEASFYGDAAVVKGD